MRDAFIGYPSGPAELVDNIEAGINIFRYWPTTTRLIPWTDIEGPSTPIISDVLKTIRETEVAFFDITIPNQNVFYEIGYAVGSGKPIYMLLNTGIKNAQKSGASILVSSTRKDESGIEMAAISRTSFATREIPTNRCQPASESTRASRFFSSITNLRSSLQQATSLA